MKFSKQWLLRKIRGVAFTQQERYDDRIEYEFL